MAIRQVFPIPRKISIFVIAFLFCAFSLPASAQRFFKLPTVEVFGGYSYLWYQSKPLGFSGNSNLNGYNVELSLPHLYEGLGIVADVSAHYNHEMQEYNFLIGPQYSFQIKNMRIYGHGLFGKSRDRLGLIGSSQIEPSSLERGLAFGGGVDLPLSERVSFRAVQADYLITSNFGGTQHNVRLSTGFVFSFGKH